MVKKLKYLLFLFPFLLITNVNAWTLSQPYVNYEFENSPYPTGAYGTESTYFNTQFYVSPFLLGGVDYSDYVKGVYFSYYNTGFCAGQDISVSGSLLGVGYQNTNKLFNDESVSIVIKNNGVALSCVLNNVNGELMNYQCYGKGGGDFNLQFILNSYHSPAQYRVGISKEISITCDASNLDVISNATANANSIINNQNGNTQVIINNQNENTQDIIDNQNENTQDIIDNQNENTDKEIESQKVCTNQVIDNSNIIFNNSFLFPTGEIAHYNNLGITDYIKINENSVIEETLTTSETNISLCFYNDNKTLLSCIEERTLIVNQPISIPNYSRYVRFTIVNTLNRPKFTINTCENGNQVLSDDINNLNDTLKNDTPPDTENQLSELDNSLISDTPITDLIILPITLLNSYISGIGGTCSSYNLGNLYGTDLILPCLNLQQRLGSNLWTIIDSLFSIFMIYNIGMLMIQAFEGFTSLRDDYEGLYQPRHADTGYQPKHGGDN